LGIGEAFQKTSNAFPNSGLSLKEFPEAAVGPDAKEEARCPRGREGWRSLRAGVHHPSRTTQAETGAKIESIALYDSALHAL